VALNLLVYDPPIAGFPYLAVAVETEAPGEVMYAETHPTLAEAEAAIVRLAGRLEAADGPPPGKTARTAGVG
jgi:hypothetical protein